MDQTETIRTRLFAMQDTGYQSFHAKLIPNVEPETIIGVRTPALRKYAKELAGTPEAEAFLKELPHRYSIRRQRQMCIRDRYRQLGDLRHVLPESLQRSPSCAV